MPSRNEHGERSRDLERVLTFVDAIAAVAITLLILPLVDLAGEIRSEHDSVSELIRSHSGEFWAFALSFVVIARLWIAQHMLMRPVVAASRAVVLCLVVWTFAIVFLPFPTALLSSGGDQTITKVLYIGTLCLSALCLALLAGAIRRDGSVRDSSGPVSVIPAAVTFALLALAFVIAVFAPATGYYPLLLLVAGDGVTELVRRFAARRRRP